MGMLAVLDEHGRLLELHLDRRAVGVDIEQIHTRPSVPFVDRGWVGWGGSRDCVGRARRPSRVACVPPFPSIDRSARTPWLSEAEEFQGKVVLGSWYNDFLAVAEVQ